MRISKQLEDLEGRAQGLASTQGGYSEASITIGGRLVACIVSDAMINRGTATGTCRRTNWKLNGKRISFANLEGALVQ